MRVSLSEADPDARNELFLKWDGVPTGADYDAAYADALAANQQAIVSSTEPGVYYILVRSLDGGPVTDAVLTAELVPFSITNVTPDQGGSGRFVTMTIEGAGIKEGAIAKLSRPGQAEFLPVASKRVDATRIIAIFDLEGAPHGLYDVVVVNADGETAIDPYRYLVERAIERDLTVGLGGPRIVPAGAAGTYSVVLDSMTNVDTPYVHFTFGAPELGSNEMVYSFPYLTFSTNVGGGSDAATDDLGLTGSQAPVNNAGQLLAPGYAFDLAAESTAALTFSIQTYPGLQALIDRDFEKLRAALYARDPALAEADGLAGGLEDLREYDEALYDLFSGTDDVIGRDMPWYLPFQFNVVAAATPMTRDEFVAEQRSEAERLRQAVLGDASAAPALQALAADADAWTDGFLAALEIAGLLREEADAPPVFEQTRVASLVATLSQGILYGPAGDEVRSDGDLVAFYAAVREWYGSTPGELAPIARYDIRTPPQGVPFDVPVAALPDFTAFDKGLSLPTTFTAFNVFSPWLGSDAVDLPDFGSDATTGDLIALDLERFRELAGAGEGGAMVGPAGYGEDNYVPAGVSLPHEIRFDLDESNPRPAREVRLVTTLDPALDPRSFRLGGLTIGDVTIDVPEGRAVYQTDLDLSESRGFILRVSAGIDVASGTATWLLQAIDPATGELLEGSGPEGLLLPADGGSVRYSVMPRRDAADGALVTASARILLDVAAPLDTPDFTYRLDLTAPETTVDTAPIAGTDDIAVSWTPVDGGSGIRHATVYVATDGGDFRIWLARTTASDAVWSGEAGHTYEFLVLATDNAGNQEVPPRGISAPDDGSRINLGGTSVGSTTPASPLPDETGNSDTPVNALFIQALEGIPAQASQSRTAAFIGALQPFGIEKLSDSVAASQGNIGALAVVGLADGSVIYSGGPDRSWLYRVTADGETSVDPFARLTEPVYGLAVDGDGRLWATTGGGALLELEPETGAILGRHGDSVTQSLAIAPDGRIAVSTGDGIAFFDPADGSFTLVSPTRVDGLAYAPDGSLWGTSWPDRGEIYRFVVQPDGGLEARLVASAAAPIDSIGFGAVGSEFEGLAILTSIETDGTSWLYALDIASHKLQAIATGPVRGEGIASLADGRIVIAHTEGLDVIRPLKAPEVLTTSIRQGEVVPRPVNSFAVQFTEDMALEGDGSVLDPNNYALIDLAGDIVPITGITWDAATRSVLLTFDPLERGSFALLISQLIESARGLALGEDTTIDFTRIEDVTATVSITYANTRIDRLAGTVTYDVVVTNLGDDELRAPLFLTLDPQTDGSGAPVDGVDSNGIWLVDLEEALGAGGRLAPGQSTTARAVSLILTGDARAAFIHGVRILSGVNEYPAIEDDIPRTATVGELYNHRLSATDEDGTTIGWVLVEAPEGMEIDPETGDLTWLPGADAPAIARVAIRAYDARGGFAEAAFTIDVAGTNQAPLLETPESLYEIDEGSPFVLPVFGEDPDGDRLAYFADNLPLGAVFDAATRTLTWTPGASQAGLYRNIVIGVTDGLATVTRSFDILVRDVDLPPEVPAPAERTIREGETLRLVIGATDPEGRDLTYSSAFLPGGATIDPETGVFEWTPRYVQAGAYDIPILVSDGLNTVQVPLKIIVENANAAPVFVGVDHWVVAEDQQLVFRAMAIDPDNPGFVLPERAPDGSLLFFEGSERISTSYAVDGLPDGAVFDPETAAFYWEPGYEAAGTYTFSLTATDDGDGTGTPAVTTIEVVIEVTDVNRPPELADLANRSILAGETLTIPLGALDPDGGDLTIAAIATRAASVDAASLDPTPVPLDGTSALGRIVETQDGPVLEFTPGAGDRGDWLIELVVTDDGNGDPANRASAAGAFILSVEAAVGPKIEPFAGFKAIAGEEAQVVLRASHPDGDVLNWSVSGLAGATIEPGQAYGEAILRWTPAVGTSGGISAIVTVTDSGNGTPANALSDSVTLDVSVDAANASPVLLPVGDLVVAEGEVLAIDVTGFDADGDALTYRAASLPAGAELDPLTGRLTFQPHRFQAGVYEGIVISVTDGLATVTKTIAITVTNTNAAPVFVETPTQRGAKAVN